jgi:hypothetical protein
MPFRFKRWPDNQVFISNLSGEYLVLPSSEFDDFIHGKLESTSTAYQDLLARQILRNDSGEWGRELLSSKLYTKKSFLRGFTKLHIFVSTLRCNQSCPYFDILPRLKAGDSYGAHPWFYTGMSRFGGFLLHRVT